MDKIYVEGSRELYEEELLDSRRLDSAEEDSQIPFPYGIEGGYSDCSPDGQIKINREVGQASVRSRELYRRSKGK